LKLLPLLLLLLPTLLGQVLQLLRVREQAELLEGQQLQG
jgi:hypothetical protein